MTKRDEFEVSQALKGAWTDTGGSWNGLNPMSQEAFLARLISVLPKEVVEKLGRLDLAARKRFILTAIPLPPD